MKKLSYMIVISLILVFSACSFHFPVDWDEDFGYRNYRVILKIDPDDAHVLLNGKFIGEAYEFSQKESALKIRSKKNELVVKKEGFREELIDLEKYGSKNITVQLTLKRDELYKVSEKQTAPPPPEKPSEKYKVVKEKDIPKNEEKSTRSITFSKVTLTIAPEDSSIYLDGKFWGVAPANGIISNFNLKKGKHRIEVLKPGYKTIVKIVEVSGKKDLQISIKLVKK
ncbi:MAG: PEGA domain-containing protein [Acidobacteriota bacterium]